MGGAVASLPDAVLRFAPDRQRREERRHAEPIAYVRFFGDGYYWGVLAQTIALSAVVTLLCLLVGYPVAFFLVRHSGTWAGLLMFCLVAPLLTSIVMRTFGWRALLGRQGVINMVLLD